MKIANLAELKNMLRGKVDRAVLSCSGLSYGGLPTGFPRGALSAVWGPGKTELVLQSLVENPEVKVAWIENSFSAFPFAFFQKAITPSRILFAESGKDGVWAALQALRARAFQLVVIYAEELGVHDAKRLQLAAERSDACVVWLCPEEIQSLSCVSLAVQTSKMGAVVHRKRFTEGEGVT